MRKIRALVFVFVLVVPCFGSISYLQSNAGGTGTGTSNGSEELTVVTSAAGYSSTTASGSFLVCIVYSKQHASIFEVGVLQPVPVTSGITWQFGGFSAFGNTGDGNAGEVDVFYSTNSASIGTSTMTTVSVTVGGIQSGITETVEFSLYEFSGVASSSPVDGSYPSLEGTSATPALTSPNNLVTTQTDLAIITYSGDPSGASNLSAGAGYTLGVNAGTATIGQAEYDLGVPAGTYNPGFSGGTNAKWGIMGIAFKPGSAPPSTPAPRHRGLIF